VELSAGTNTITLKAEEIRPGGCMNLLHLTLKPE
jgi:hypothetical protein